MTKDVPIEFLIVDVANFAACFLTGDLSKIDLETCQPIQITEDFHVRDGHHRIAKACALGRTTIKAEVV